MNEREILLYNSLKRLHLLERAPGREVVRDLCGLQAQFARNPQISLWLRASDYTPETWDEGLVKTWSHRGTMHVVLAEELGLHLSAAAQGGDFRDGMWGMTAAQMREWAPFILAEVRRGNDTRDGLKEACRARGMDEALLKCAFYGWGGLIKELCWRGRLVIGTGVEKTYAVPPAVEFMDRDAARRVFLRRYFERFGPATLEDCRQFFAGYRAGDLNPLFEELLPTLARSRLDGRDYYHAGPLITEAALPECVLIPGFDQLVLGYRNRDRLIDPVHKRKLVNVAGIVCPAVLVRGRIRAAWKLKGDAVLVTPFEHLLRKDEAAIRRAVRARLYPAVKRTVFEEG